MEKYKNFGYNYFGPLLYGFSMWLIENLNREGIGKVYFFSRDGFIMKKAFDMLNHGRPVKTYYLEVSRRSLRVPILWKDYSFDNILSMLGPSKLITINSIFDAVGLNISDYVRLLDKYSFDENSVFYRGDIQKNKELLSMYDELSRDIEENSKQEYDILVEYLKQNEIGGKFAVVDIGWSGGMQRFLETTLKEMNIDADIYGYYTGVADYYSRNIKDGIQLNLNGWLFDFYHNPQDQDPRSCFVGLYEILFLETKGSVKKYIKDGNNKVSAERYDYEYNVNGKIMNEVEYIKDVQDGALLYIQHNININTIEPNARQLCKPLLDAGQLPTKEAIDLFSDFKFYDEGEYTFLAKPQSLTYYVFHPQAFKMDFYKNRWKSAFLRKVFKVPISYYRVYKFLKKLAL